MHETEERAEGRTLVGGASMTKANMQAADREECYGWRQQ